MRASSRRTSARRGRRAAARAQSTLEWVIGAAIILGTLATAILAWNQGLAAKIGSLVSQLTK
jgi:hypothetical protein